MRDVGAHLLEDKMDEAVTQYITSHQANEHPVHVNSNTLALNIQDDGGGRVTVMHTQSFTSPLCRQVSVGEQVGDGPWSEELLDPDSRIAAIVAQLSQNSRTSHHHHQPNHHKMTSVRSDVDSSVILDGSMRLLSSQAIVDHQQEQIVVHVPPLTPLPPLQEMKRCADTDWFNSKSRTATVLKVDSPILEESQSPDLELETNHSPVHNKHQNKKSLPHKKRISKKLKKNGSTSPQDIVVINCTEEVHHEEILPDNFVTSVQHQEQLSEDSHHITHEVRPILLCQLCGEFYGDDQLKFYHHLKQHYEPHATIIIENPVTDLAMDKMTNTCIVDNVANLPDSIVELSLENTVPKTIYQNIDKHILYTSEKTLNYSSNRGLQYSIEKEQETSTEPEKADLYESLDRLELYSCMKCNKSFRKQKHCEMHIKEAHSNAKSEDMGEFSEPEDLMEGIHVSVEEGAEQYEHTVLPHLTVDNGHVHQEHVRHWYLRANTNNGQMCTADGAFCPVCPASVSAPPSVPVPVSASAPVSVSASHVSEQQTREQPHDPQPLKVLKEEVLKRILETEVATEDHIISSNMMGSNEPPLPIPVQDPKGEKKKQAKKYGCSQCERVFRHRSSLLYHVLSHGTKQQICRDCGKSFYTKGALKIHKRVHNGDRPYKCDVCGKDFRQWSDLKYHKVIHTNQKRFKCEFCGKEFARKYSLNVHRRIHTGERNYKCEYCNKCFSASSYRLTHMRTHTGDRPHQCDQCDKCFRVAFDLRRHILTHEKARNRLEQQKLKVKEEMHHETEKLDDSTAESPKTKKIALASTTKPQTAIKVDKKTKPVKKNGKRGAPNVTVGQANGQFRINGEYTNNVEVFDTRQQEGYGKFKEVYSENPDLSKDVEMKTYRIYNDRGYATLKPLRSNMLDDQDKLVYNRTENTDGKMQIFTHIEKNKEYVSSIVPNTQALADMRHLDREVGREVRTDITGETIENVFFERLNSFYNIPAV